MWLRALVTVIALALPSALWAQVTPQQAAKDGLRLYNEGEFSEALRMLNLAADSIDSFSPAQQAAVFKYIAFCHIAEQRREEAKFAFKRALSYKPDLKLDEKRLSPRIIEVFKQARLEVEAMKSSNNSAATLDLTVPKYDVSGALWRSAAAPGWGQIYSERKIPGYVAAGANAAAIGYAVVWSLEAARAERFADDVRADGSIEGDNAKYLTQAREARVNRNVALGIAAGVYTLTLIDATVFPTLSRSKAKRAPSPEAKIRGGVTPTAGYVELLVEF